MLYWFQTSQNYHAFFANSKELEEADRLCKNKKICLFHHHFNHHWYETLKKYSSNYLYFQYSWSYLVGDAPGKQIKYPICQKALDLEVRY